MKLDTVTEHASNPESASLAHVIKFLGSEQTRILIVALGLALAFFLGKIFNLLLFSHPAHDQTWYLYAASLVADGVKLYGPRLTETNPPLIIYLSMIPILLGRLLHLQPLVMLKAMVVVMSLASSLWCARLLRLAEVAGGPIILFFAACASLIFELKVQPRDFGQREQMVVMLTLPYLLAATLRLRRRFAPIESVALGVFAGIGFCLKPQQILVLVALELFLALLTRSLRRALSVSFLTLVATVAAYLLLIRVAAPGYFVDTIPLLRKTYWAYGPASAQSIVRSAPSFELGFLLLCLLCIVLRKRLHQPLASAGLLVCGFAAWLAYYVQHTGLAYQRIPMNVFFGLAGSALLIDLCAPILIHLARAPGFALLFSVSTALGCAVALSVGLKPQLDTADAFTKYQQAFDAYPPGTPVYVFSSSLAGFENIFNQDFVWASRFAHLWMLPAIVDNEYAHAGGPIPRKILTPETTASLAALQRTDTTEDLQTWKPTVILVERCGLKDSCTAITDRGFDYIRWFSQDPAFVSEWAKYRRQPSTYRFDVYTRSP